jgi:hypothetical protein
VRFIHRQLEEDNYCLRLPPVNHSLVVYHTNTIAQRWTNANKMNLRNQYIGKILGNDDVLSSAGHTGTTVPLQALAKHSSNEAAGSRKRTSRKREDSRQADRKTPLRQRHWYHCKTGFKEELVCSKLSLLHSIHYRPVQLRKLIVIQIIATIIHNNKNDTISETTNENYTTPSYE